jgi:hypothetical protein
MAEASRNGKWQPRYANGSLDMMSQAGEPGTARAASRRSPQENRKTSSSTQASGEQSAPAASPRRWRRPLLIMGPVALVIGALGLYLATGRYVSEEDGSEVEHRGQQGCSAVHLDPERKPSRSSTISS